MIVLIGRCGSQLGIKALIKSFEKIVIRKLKSQLLILNRLQNITLDPCQK